MEKCFYRPSLLFVVALNCHLTFLQFTSELQIFALFFFQRKSERESLAGPENSIPISGFLSFEVYETIIYYQSM
jgi:hypothetical protein